MCQNLLERETIMPAPRNRSSAEFKAKLAREVLQGERTLTEIARDAKVHPNRLLQCKRPLLQSLPTGFADKRVQDNPEPEAKPAQRYPQRGQLKVELDWMKQRGTPRLRATGAGSSQVICLSASPGRVTGGGCPAAASPR